MKAAVMRAYKQPLEIAEVQIGKPGPHEVLVRTAATGVCHSDLHVLEGALPVPPPTILGHEPSGIVEVDADAQIHLVGAGVLLELFVEREDGVAGVGVDMLEHGLSCGGSGNYRASAGAGSPSACSMSGVSEAGVSVGA